MLVKRLTLLLVLACLGRGTLADAAEAGRIVVARAATVDGASVRLADLAVLEGMAREFAELDLGPAPEPGASRRVEGLTILSRLREAGLDEDATRYQIPASVRVIRAARRLRADEMRSVVEDQIGAHLRSGESLRALELPASVKIPSGDYDLRVLPPAAATRVGPRRFFVEVVQSGKTVARFPVRAEIAAFGSVVTVRHPVARGTILTAADLDVEERDRSGLPADVVTASAQAVGKEARVALAPATPLTLQQLAKPLLVRRGDVVTVVVETPGVRLSVPGEALEGGAAAASIRVRNRKSQQELVGQVVDHGMVLVQY